MSMMARLSGGDPLRTAFLVRAEIEVRIEHLAVTF